MILSPQFPEGLRVLLVDGDLVCLKSMEKMLEQCRYQVTKFSEVDGALTHLRSNTNKFDIMISGVRTNDELLMKVAFRMDISVILMYSADEEDIKSIIKAVARGAHYLVKPVTMESVRSIWQHVVRKRKYLWKDMELNEDDSQEEKALESSVSKRRKTMQQDDRNHNNGGCENPELDKHLTTHPIKKARVVWSSELHQQFVAAVLKLGIDKAVPKKILESMNVPELTRENVASHLQKYRLNLKRIQKAEVQSAAGSANQQKGHQVAGATHKYNANHHHHNHHHQQRQQQLIHQQLNIYKDQVQKKRQQMNSGEFSMFNSERRNVILSRRAVNRTTSIPAAAIRTEGGGGRGGGGSSAIMSRLSPLSNYHQPNNNEMTFLPWRNNHNLITNLLDSDAAANTYSEPVYDTFSHITSDDSEFRNNIFEDDENSFLPNLLSGEVRQSWIEPVVLNNPTSDSLLPRAQLVSQFNSEHLKWMDNPYSGKELQ